MTYREEEEFDDADNDDESLRPNVNAVWDLFPNNERNIFWKFCSQNKDYSSMVLWKYDDTVLKRDNT